MLSLLSGTGVKQDVLTMAAFGIQATAMHMETNVGKDVERLMDLDVHSFGYSFERYIDNSDNIRSEYVNDDANFMGIPNEKFVAGRIDFLKKFVGKGFVFRTDYFKTHFEDKAKSNILKEIDMLEQFQKNV
jgi:predicted metal-dependent HD superfamily phosphohydrolase